MQLRGLCELRISADGNGLASACGGRLKPDEFKMAIMTAKLDHHGVANFGFGCRCSTAASKAKLVEEIRHRISAVEREVTAR